MAAEARAVRWASWRSGAARGALALPVAALAALVACAVDLQTVPPSIRPARALLCVALASGLLRTRTARMLFFFPLTVAAYLALPPFGRPFRLGPFEIIVAFAAGIALTPVLAVSLRAGGTAAERPIEAARRRSPWIVALATVAPLTELTLGSDWDMTRDGPLPPNGPILAIYVGALAAVVALAALDIRALRTAWIAPGEGSPDGKGRLGPFLRSAALDTLAVAVTVAYVISRWGGGHGQVPHGEVL